MKHDYPIATGELDRQRLTLLNKILNPTTHPFLLKNGLKTGMKILEIGCGIGQMACWLAHQVAPTGKISAIDNSAEQLVIAEQIAKKAGITNIDFMQFDIRNLSELKDKFDFIYGRAVIEFNEGRENILKELYRLLKPQGIFTYESVSAIESGHFSCPHQSDIDQYFSVNKDYFKKSKMAADFPGDLYQYLKQLDYKGIVIKTNQPVLMNSEDKSILRLGIINTRNTIYKNYSDAEFEAIVQQIQKIEQDDNIIIGFFRSLLFKGNK